MSEYRFPLIPEVQNGEPTPESCMADGLSCEACVAASGRALAQVCYGLRGTSLGRLFTQMYPGTACSRMHATFKAAYREASEERMHSESAEVLMEASQLEAPTLEAIEEPGFTRVDLSGPARRPAKQTMAQAERPRTMAAYA